MTAPALPDPRLKEINGYEKLGKYISEFPEFAAFQGFKDLYAENLLYQQAEILYLAKELGEIRRVDRGGEPSRDSYHRDWEKLREAKDEKQLQKILELRGALDKYYESLFRYERVLKMNQPHRHTLTDTFEYMRRPTLGKIYLDKLVQDCFETADPRDMVSLDDTTVDSLTSWVQYHVVDIYHRHIGSWFHKSNNSPHLEGTTSYDPGAIGKLTRLVTVVLACALPIGSIFILHFVVDEIARLGIVFGLSVAFSLCMALMTPAKTHEIFGATSTFAAVLVVFISTDGPATTDGSVTG
ncbi:hypothetical protein OQA88_1145 [Cercophora sp. LCS_1]